MPLQMKLYQTYNYFEVVEAVQDLLCKRPVGEMFPPKMTCDDVESWFANHTEGHGNGAYVSFWTEPWEYDDPDDALIKKAIREVVGTEEIILLHHSW